MNNRTLFPRNWLHDQRLPYTSGKLKSGASMPTSGRCNVTLTVETPFVSRSVADVNCLIAIGGSVLARRPLHNLGAGKRLLLLSRESPPM